MARAAMLLGLKTGAVRKRREEELEAAEIKIPRFSLGEIRMERIRNESIRGAEYVRCIAVRAREARQRFFVF